MDHLVVRGVLHRSFPLYRESDCNANPTGGSRTLVYRPADQSWHLGQ